MATNLSPAWHIIEARRTGDHYYPWHVEGVNGHALGTSYERFCWSVRSILDGYAVHPDADPETRALLAAEGLV